MRKRREKMEVERRGREETDGIGGVIQRKRKKGGDERREREEREVAKKKKRLANKTSQTKGGRGERERGERGRWRQRERTLCIVNLRPPNPPAKSDLISKTLSHTRIHIHIHTRTLAHSSTLPLYL